MKPFWKMYCFKMLGSTICNTVPTCVWMSVHHVILASSGAHGSAAPIVHYEERCSFISQNMCSIHCNRASGLHRFTTNMSMASKTVAGTHKL